MARMALELAEGDMKPECTKVRLDCFQALALGLIILVVSSFIAYLIASELDHEISAPVDHRVDQLETKMSFVLKFLSDREGDKYLEELGKDRWNEIREDTSINTGQSGPSR